jgi:hypothetical protein
MQMTIEYRGISTKTDKKTLRFNRKSWVDKGVLLNFQQRWEQIL